MIKKKDLKGFFKSERKTKSLIVVVNKGCRGKMKILVIFGWVIFRGRGVFFDDRVTFDGRGRGFYNQICIFSRDQGGFLKIQVTLF